MEYLSTIMWADLPFITFLEEVEKLYNWPDEKLLNYGMEFELICLQWGMTT